MRFSLADDRLIHQGSRNASRESKAHPAPVKEGTQYKFAFMQSQQQTQSISLPKYSQQNRQNQEIKKKQRAVLSALRTSQVLEDSDRNQENAILKVKQQKISNRQTAHSSAKLEGQHKIRGRILSSNIFRSVAHHSQQPTQRGCDQQVLQDKTTQLNISTNRSKPSCSHLCGSSNCTAGNYAPASYNAANCTQTNCSAAGYSSGYGANGGNNR